MLMYELIHKHFFMQLKFIIDKAYDKQFASKRQLAYLEELYQQIPDKLQYSRREYQKSWNMIGQDFSDYIERETGYAWFYKTYYCIVSAVHPGISNWGNEPKIIRWWSENAFTQRRITAHELILSHYFEIYKHHYINNGLNDQQVWALAEIAAFALTSLCPITKSFWPWDSSGYYYNHNYPQLVALQKKLKSAFLKKKDFDEYIRKGIKEVKNGKILF